MFAVCIFVSTMITVAVFSTVSSTYTAAKFAEDNNKLLREIAERETVHVEYVLPIKDEPEITTEITTQESDLNPPTDEIQDEGETTLAETEETVTETTTSVVATFDKEIGKDVILPDLPTDRKVCTDYRVYNIPGTPHNRMQLAAHTDGQGCRRYGEFYIVGLGSAYANRVGETFEVELDTGAIFTIITGDMKPDDDTDITHRFEGCYNYDGAYCANILEFIIDKETFDTRAYQWGGVDWYENFKGNIVRMTYLGRDTSADWDIYT